MIGAARRVLRWLALRGSPAGNRARPDIPAPSRHSKAASNGGARWFVPGFEAVHKQRKVAQRGGAISPARALPAVLSADRRASAHRRRKTKKGRGNRSLAHRAVRLADPHFARNRCGGLVAFTFFGLTPGLAGVPHSPPLGFRSEFTSGLCLSLGLTSGALGPERGFAGH
jgi:hypothetical protein